MNFESLPDDAQVALKEMFKLLDQASFDAEEATFQGLLFVRAAVKDRLRGSSTLYRGVEELLRQHARHRPRARL